jgi:type II secretory pathway component GspD/PulD (secretin)
MMRMRHWTLRCVGTPAIVAALALLPALLAGCSSSADVTDGPTDYHRPAQMPAGDDGAGADDAAAADEPATADAPVMAGDDAADEAFASEALGAELEGLTEAQRREVTELDQTARYILERARRELAEGQLVRARQRLSMILDRLSEAAMTYDALKVRRDEVRRVYNEVASMIAETTSVTDTEASELSARAQQAVIQAKLRLREAEQLMAEGKYEEAEWAYMNAKAIGRHGVQSPALDAVVDEKYIDDRIREARELNRKLRFEEQKNQEDILRKQILEQVRKNEAQKQETLEKLWGDALANMNLGRYDTAAFYCRQIVAADPNFKQAQEMLEAIEDLRTRKLQDDVRIKRQRAYRRLWLDWVESKVPLTGDPVRFPGSAEWARILERAEQMATTTAESAAVAQTRNKLDTSVMNRNFEQTPMLDVIKDLRASTGVQIQLSGEARLEAEDTFIDLPAQGLSAADTLQLLADTAAMRYIIRATGVVTLSLEDEEFFDTDNLVIKLHDVRDLTVPVKDFPGVRIRLRDNESEVGGGFGGLKFGDDDDDQIEEIELDLLPELIVESVVPEAWEDGGGLGTIFPIGGQLLVRTTPDVHNEIRGFLSELREVSGIVITISARFITVDDMMISDFGIDWRGLGGQSPGNTVLLDDVTTREPDFAGGLNDNGSNAIPPGAAIAGLFFNSGTPDAARDIRGRTENVFDTALGSVLRTTGGLGLQYTIFEQNDKQFQLVLNALEKHLNATVLVAPRLSAFNTQRADLTVVNQVAYVRDFTITTAASAAIADPVVDRISDGLVLDVKPTVSNDRRFVTIELQPTIAELARPIPTFTTTLGGANSTPVTIQLPELVVQSLQTTVMCPDGGVVVVGGLKSVRDVDRESTIPLLGDIPILGALFRRKGRSLENRSVIVVCRADITDLREHEQQRP